MLFGSTGLRRYSDTLLHSTTEEPLRSHNLTNGSSWFPDAGWSTNSGGDRMVNFRPLRRPWRTTE